MQVEFENRAVTGVEGRVMCGARVKPAAPGAGVNDPVSMEPFACAGRKPGWSPKMASNCFSRSSAKATIFSSEGSGMMTSCDTVAEVSRRRSSRSPDMRRQQPVETERIALAFATGSPFVKSRMN